MTMEVEKKPSLFSDFLKTFLVLALLLLFSFLVLTYLGQRVSVEGNSMQPALADGDQLLVDKLSYRLREPVRCELVVFQLEEEPDTYYVKRIIGMPGETVQLQDGEIYINDQRMIETYGLETYLDAGIASEPLVLGPEEYFVLGDNRNDSRDSRSAGLGPVRREQIVGRVLFRIWPFSESGTVK